MNNRDALVKLKQTATLTPMERVEALLLEINEGRVYKEVGPVAELSRQLAAEIEEANRRAEKWAKDAGRYAANADFWRKRAEAAERERDAIHAGELAAMEGCDDIPNDYTPNGKLAWLVGSYKTKLQAAERQLAEKSVECERLREDAERYRWLRDTDTRDYAVIFEDKSICMKFGTHLDAAIDAARKEK